MSTHEDTRPAARQAKRRLRIGTCGFPEAQARLFRDFDILEIQQTFYQLPRLPTVARWRARAPSDFVFTLKAWQLITHGARSPTYRRLTEPLSRRERAAAGDFRWNGVTRMAWHRTLAIAEALGARATVFQSPASFLPSASNLRRVAHFFERIERRGCHMVFEPRGPAWTDTIVRDLVRDLDLVHAVDPFLRRPLSAGLRYFRLHGRPAYHYRYRYTAADLHSLATMTSTRRQTWILFNNDAMALDARRFQRLLARR